MKKLLFIVLLWLSFWVPVFLFEEAFRSQFFAKELMGGVYRDAPLVYLSVSLVLSILTSWFSPRFFSQLWYKVLIAVVFFLFFKEMCTQVAYDYRIHFGTTWQYSELFPELVTPHWYFYFFGIFGVLMHFVIHYLWIKQRRVL